MNVPEAARVAPRAILELDIAFHDWYITFSVKSNYFGQVLVEKLKPDTMCKPVDV